LSDFLGSESSIPHFGLTQLTSSYTLHSEVVTAGCTARGYGRFSNCLLQRRRFTSCVLVRLYHRDVLTEVLCHLQILSDIAFVSRLARGPDVHLPA
jgi:hypothetical protein